MLGIPFLIFCVQPSGHIKTDIWWCCFTRRHPWASMERHWSWSKRDQDSACGCSSNQKPASCKTAKDESEFANHPSCRQTGWTPDAFWERGLHLGRREAADLSAEEDGFWKDPRKTWAWRLFCSRFPSYLCDGVEGTRHVSSGSVKVIRPHEHHCHREMLCGIPQTRNE